MDLGIRSALEAAPSSGTRSRDAGINAEAVVERRWQVKERDHV
jgi:hypothetical protein